ncbi:MAG: 50S ribosomal protein L22 [Deltaproteobacteria bacterium]|nr:MAG: 50S ribosomal protein L22 [Deltaproteobacteria bacterium]RME43838.1 MAG: 50S ribosomal protein L22 [Deltaproteobacteria bacterium]
MENEHVNEVKARARFVRQSPRKLRLIADLIRGKRAEDALHTLTYSKKRGARTFKKLLESGIANAQEQSLDLDRLVIKTVMVDGGPSLHRFMPRAMGRATPILKRTSHITMVLAASS